VHNTLSALLGNSRHRKCRI